MKTVFAYLHVLHLFLIFCLIGVFAIQNVVNYRTWLFIGENECPAYHRKLDDLLNPFLRIPLGLALVISWLMWFVHFRQRTRLLWLANALCISAFVAISITVHVPMHQQLNETHDAELLHTLISTNMMYRLPLVVAMLLIHLRLLWLQINP